MNEISPEQLLQQIRSMGRELQTNATDNARTATSNQFGEALKDSINAVNESQLQSQKMAVDFVSGTGSASLAEVMVATQKADLSFRAMTEVRNKLVSAYQDIMNMPV